MMTEKEWNDLFDAFRDDSKFDENGYADESDFENLHLYKWLECNGSRPSEEMRKAFAFRGYDVFPVERDSYGWLVGGVREKLLPYSKVITFG